jgi:hypothetical protein
LEVRPSDAAPTLWNHKKVTEQWVFLWRDAEARRALEELLDRGRSLAATLSDPTPFARHAFLAVRVDASGLELCLRVPGGAWVDARNLRAVTLDPAAGDALVDAVRALPQGFALHHAEGTTEAAGVGRAELVRSAGTLEGSQGHFSLSLAVPRAEVLAAGEALVGALAPAFSALLGLYRSVAWSAANDRVSALAAAQSAHTQREAHLREEAAREAAWKAEHDGAIERRREAAAAQARERVSSQEPVRPAAVQAAVQPAVDAARREADLARKEVEKARLEAQAQEALARAAQIHPPRRPVPRGPMRTHTDIAPHPPEASRRVSKVVPSGGAPAREDRGSPVVPGTKVKVCAGPFAGRIGTVTELDGRGVKVAFGLLSARIEAADLVCLVDG